MRLAAAGLAGLDLASDISDEPDTLPKSSVA